jgi:RNA polymerase sigma-70 factor (ECF subfamily)
VSFETIYDEEASFVWRSIRRLGIPLQATGDVFQEVFLHVHRRLSEFEGRSSIRTWLFAITLRVVRHHQRTYARLQRRLDVHAELDVVPDGSRSPLEDATHAEAVRLLHRLLDHLDDEKREVFILAELESMSAREIGQALGLSPNTVSSRLRAARAAFEQALLQHHARDEWRLR